MNDNPNKVTTESQNRRILSALLAGETLTDLDALRRFDCRRLGARIYDIQKSGHKIIHEWVVTPSKKRVMSYRYDMAQ